MSVTAFCRTVRYIPPVYGKRCKTRFRNQVNLYFLLQSSYLLPRIYLLSLPEIYELLDGYEDLMKSLKYLSGWYQFDFN